MFMNSVAWCDIPNKYSRFILRQICAAELITEFVFALRTLVGTTATHQCIQFCHTPLIDSYLDVTHIVLANPMHTRNLKNFIFVDRLTPLKSIILSFLCSSL